MGETRQDSTRRSILMLPWLAHGHISPYLELAKKLTNTNKFHVYFCSTPINLISIKKKLSGVPNYSHSIELVELHLPSNHRGEELPPHHHTTNGLPSHLMAALKSVFEEESKPNFANILKTLNPDLVLYDFNMPWVPVAASSLNIPAVLFLPFGVVFASFARKEGNEKYPFEGIYLHEHEIPQFENLLGCSVNGIRDGDRYKEAIRNSRELILVKTSREIEGRFIEYLSRLTNKRIQPVGSLVQKYLDDDDDDDDDGLEILKWLEEKKESSTVFVSFGSEYFLPKQEIEEIAHGLELSEVNFIWVVRFPVGDETRVEEVFPQGFLERLGGWRGLVIEGWAPQVKILRHRSIGGFVSHCGWNSVLESINIGVPIIAMPMQIDQPLNARVVEEIGVGMEVKRDKFGKFGREVIARIIRMVVLESKGVDLKCKAKEISAKISRVEDEELDDAVSEFVRICGS